mgnify:CR=1 FL=1
MSTAVRRRTVFQSEQDPILNPPEGYRVPGPSNEPDPRLNPPSDTYAPGPPMVTPAPTQQGRKAIPRVPPGNEAPPPDTTTPPPAPTKPQWTAPSDGDWRKWWFANVVQNGQLSVQRLKDVTADLAKLGIKVLDDDEIHLPNGQIIDVIKGARSASYRPRWRP